MNPEEMIAKNYSERKPHKITSNNKTFWGMNHINGNLLCAVDIETTGLDIDNHGILEIAVLPLNGMLEPHEHFHLFHMRMKPEDGEDFDLDAMRITGKDLCDVKLNGFDRETVADYFLRWFESLGLAKNKRIMPLAANWPFDREWIARWIGRESMDYLFDPRYRDVQTASLFLNDCADIRCEEVPFPKVNLKYLASQLKVNNPYAHSALGDAITTAAIYKKMMGMRPGLL